MVKIVLKWNKSVFDDVEVDPTLGVSGFKDIVYSLTSVPKDRQKLMAKGAWTGTLKDETDLNAVLLKEGHQVMLMGSAEVIAAPKESVKFVEDMTVEEQALKGAIIPAGLVNMGNTCYMNATVECFRYMPEVREALNGSHSINLATLLKSTFNELDKSGMSLPPYSFVNNLRTNFPQFAEMTPQGRYMQQDAEEFYNTLTSSIQREVDRTPIPFNTLLGVEMEERLTCQETDQEAAVLKREGVNKLVCNIQGGSGAAVNIDHMFEGLKLGLEGTVEKFSTVLGRNALWTRKQRVASLPRYLCFQFMRFFWKPTPDSRDHTGVKCKILRAVTFPETFDVYDLCTEDLQRKLRINRQEADKAFEAELAQKRAKTSAEATPGTSSGANLTTQFAVAAAPTATATPAAPVVAAASSAMDEDMDEDEALALAQAMQMSMGDEAVTESAMDTTAAISGEKADSSSSSAPAAAMPVPVEVSNGPVALGNGLPVGFTGQYELHAIVTHKGRSADSGHYIGWVRQSPGSAFWWCYNDDVVTEVRTEDIMKLGGGGDRDMAYMNFYRFRDVKN